MVMGWLEGGPEGGGVPPPPPTPNRPTWTLPNRPAAWLAGRNTACAWGPSSQGGLGHPGARLLNGSQVHEHAQEHSLCVLVEPAKAAVLAAVNCTYCRPCPQLDAGQSWATPPPSCARRGPVSRSWLATSTRRRARAREGGSPRPWAGKARYPSFAVRTGRATRRMSSGTWCAPSERELDWILMGPHIPCVQA